MEPVRIEIAASERQRPFHEMGFVGIERMGVSVGYSPETEYARKEKAAMAIQANLSGSIRALSIISAVPAFAPA